MEKRGLVRGSPEALGEEHPVSISEFRRPGCLILIERFRVHAIRFRDIVDLEISECRHINHRAVSRLEPRLRKSIAGQIHTQRLGFARSEIRRRVVGIWFRKNPALFIQRQGREMTSRTADLVEDFFAQKYRPLNFGIIWDDSTRRLQRSLIDYGCSYVGACHFIHNAVYILISVYTEPFRGLNAVVLVECRVCELPQGHDIACLVPWPYHQTRWILCSVGDETGTGEAFDFGR